MLNIDFDALDPYLPEWLRYMRDKHIVRRIYQIRLGKSFDWNHPKTYSEKLQVYKISKSMENYASYVDKWGVREYIKKIIGEKHLIKTYGCFNSVTDINFDNLPNSFVLKPTHGSGWVIICKDKKTFDWNSETNKLQIWMKANFYFKLRERQYRPLKPRVIIEEYIQEENQSPRDYKIFCFGGKPFSVEVDLDRFTDNRKQIMYDLDWNLLFFKDKKNTGIRVDTPSPENLDELLHIAEKLSKPFPQVRVDLYINKGIVYFSELTLTTASGLSSFIVGKWDRLYGDKFNLEI